MDEIKPNALGIERLEGLLACKLATKLAKVPSVSALPLVFMPEEKTDLRRGYLGAVLVAKP